MRSILAAVTLIAVAVFLASCGPGLVALGGGGTGTWLGLSGGDDDEKKDTGPVVIDNFEPAVIVTSLVREESPARINYSIIDPNADLCTIQFEYSINNGANYFNCTLGAVVGGEGTSDLASSAGGTPHTFEWDFQSDIGTQLTADVDLRARAQDGMQFGDWFNLPNQSIGNDGPVISNIALIGNTGVLLITFNVSDQNSDLASFGIEWSIDQAQNWTQVITAQEILGNEPVGLLSSATPGSPGQVIWNSGVALTNYVGNVYMRFAPTDQPPGYTSPTPGTPVVAGPFALNNLTNQPPTLQLERSYTGQTFVSRVPIDFTVWDGESDATAVVVRYTVDGSNFLPATMPGEFAAGVAGPFSTTPSPTLYGIQWDALADLGGLPGINTVGVEVRLALLPADANSGQPVLTDVFRVVGNTPPAIVAVQPLNSFGNVPVTFRVVDVSSDPVSITVEYSTNGTTYLPLTQADFAFGSLDSLQSSPIGLDNLLVWDTLRQFSGATANHANVLLRVRPTDHPASATPSADLQGELFVSGAFAVINDPAGATPVSVEIFTTNNGGPVPSSPQLVTVPLGGLRNFNRSISPSSAVGFETFWAVLEGSNYGTLKDLNGAPLTYSTGSLTPNNPVAINNGDTFVLGDGLTAPVTFEFFKSGSPVTSNVLVDIQSATTNAQVAAAMVTAINAAGMRLAASAIGSQVNIAHQIACNVGNAVTNGGNAANIQSTGACIVLASNLAGGVAPAEVRFEAPATAPAGSDKVTVRCVIDDPAFFNVQDSHVLHWGDIPASVLITPSNPSVLVGTSVNLAAQVQPANAPQSVTWEVVGGFANGTITIAGAYTAPVSMPASNQVTVRAHSVQSGVSGTAQVTLLPEPTSVTVSAAGNVSQLDLSASPTQLSTLQFSAQVLPGAAPQGVNWRIFWNNSDYGTGNATVGTINTFGVYTAPLTLPSPNSVSIQALSQVKPTVYGFRQLDLTAPPPTSFQVTPNPVLVYANGQGVLFSATNFAPANANTAVTWSLSQTTGFGSINASTGFYTPPTTLSVATNLFAIATSALNSAVVAQATIQLQPPQQAAPVLILISPTEGLTTASAFGPPLQFVSTVFPVQAPQGVAWSILGTAIGSVSATGKYTPGPSAIDYVETIQAASTVVGSTVTQTVQVAVSGSGHTSTQAADVPMGRVDATQVWDAQNNRMWFIGGASELSTPGHEVSVTWYSPVANQFGTGPSLVLPGSVIAITGTFEGAPSANRRLWAICSTGSSSPVLSVFFLNVATLPLPTSWTSVAVGGTSADIPQLTASVRYPCWYDSVPNRVCVMRDAATVYRFTPSPTVATWSRLNVSGAGSNGPEQFTNSSFCWDDSTRKAYFVGPKQKFIVIIIVPVADGFTTALHELDMNPATPSWSVRSTTGGPGVGNSNGALFRGTSPSILWLFGGRDDDASPVAFNNRLWRINLGVSPASFTQMAVSGAWPSARTGSVAGITPTPGGGVLLGGKNSAGGIHGELWRFSETPSHFTRPSPVGIIPQGRSHATGAVSAGTGYVYGGLTAVGVSNELWSFTLSGGVLSWVLETTSGATPPPALIRAAAIVDTTTTPPILYMFGGTTSADSPAANAIGDVYALNLQSKAWTKLTATGGPSARFGAAMCPIYGGTGQMTALYVYGGQDASGLKGDLWRLNLGGTPSWQVVTPVNAAPDARHGATMGWDSRRNRLFVVGGFSTPSGANRQCNQYDLQSNTWSSPATDNNTLAEFVFESGGAYDLSLRRVFHAPAGKPKNQALVVTTINPTWQVLVAPAGTQNHMTGTTGLYDPVAGRYYAVFGERAVGARAVGSNGMRWLAVK